MKRVWFCLLLVPVFLTLRLLLQEPHQNFDSFPLQVQYYLTNSSSVSFRPSYRPWKNPHHGNSSHYLLFIAIITSPEHYQRRIDLRELLWVKELRKIQQQDPLLLHYKFFLGGSARNPKLIEEQEKYGDLILLDDLEDVYSNLTLKIIKAFQWAAAQKHQKQGFVFTYLAKMDDDLWLNSELLVQDLRYRALTQSKKKVFGTILSYSPVIRDKKSKWGDLSYPLDRYPPYPAGPCYFLIEDIVQLLSRLESKNHLKHWHNEDASVGSWLLGLNIELLHVPQRYYINGDCPSRHAICFHASGKSTKEKLIYTDNWKGCGTPCRCTKLSRLAYSFRVSLLHLLIPLIFICLFIVFGCFVWLTRTQRAHF